MFVANPKQHIIEYHSSYVQAWWWLHYVKGMLVIAREFFSIPFKNKLNIY
jgi:hypothetical protein